MGFDALKPNDKITSLIRDYGVGAIVLFKRNVRDAAQLQKLCSDLQQIAKEAGHAQPLLLGIDQENGLVTRIPPPVAAQMPGPMTIGATGSPDAAYEVGKATSEMLRYFGINMNYAPVGDINNEPLNPVIGVRSPGDDPEHVARFASACAKGLRENHVVPCMKHFPGHGDTATDSHFGLPVIDKSREDMEKMELIPFRRAVEENIEMIMTAHISMPNFAGSELPATLSSEALAMLRKDMNYDGVIMTDCLEMDGIRATYGTVEGALMALQAGADNVMICHTYDVQTAAIDHVCKAIQDGEISQERIDESLSRLEKLKSRFTSWDKALQTEPPETLAAINERGKKLARQVYADAATVVRSKDGLLPLSRTAKTVFVASGPKLKSSLSGGVLGGEDTDFTPRDNQSTSFEHILKEYNADIVDFHFETTDLSAEEWQQIEQAESVILATRNAQKSKYQTQLAMELARRCGSKMVTIAACDPYDFLETPEMATYITVYEPSAEAFRAAVDIVYGASPARGSLPVANQKK